MTERPTDPDAAAKAQGPVTDDGDLRRWAVEQVISHRSGNGFTLPTVIEEAKKIIEFVKTGDIKGA